MTNTPHLPLVNTFPRSQLLDALTNGSGDFDRERYLVELPQKLEIKERRVKSAVDASAKERKRATLVQGVSYLRQKDVPNIVKNLNNLLSCHKVGHLPLPTIISRSKGNQFPCSMESLSGCV